MFAAKVTASSSFRKKIITSKLSLWDKETTSRVSQQIYIHLINCILKSESISFLII